MATGLILLFVLYLSGCASLEEEVYQTPEVPKKAAWRGAENLQQFGTETINPQWWRQFGNPQLNNLLSQAISGNQNLKILAARIGVAEAAIGQANAARLPSLQAGAGVSLERTTGLSTVEQYNAAGSLNWELDIWGKVKKGVEAQEAETQAAKADWSAGFLTLAAEVAAGYFQLLKFDEQIAIQKSTLADSRQILAIAENLFQEGIKPKTQVLQQRAEINQLQRDLIELHRLRELSENSLATLTGKAAGELRIPSASLSDNIRIIEVPAGVPSELLQRRPDIVASELRLLKVHNLEAQARLAKLPSFGLTSRLGTSSFRLTDLLKSFTGGLLPSLNIPILDPSIHAQYQVSKAQSKVVREEYLAVVMKALEEVENSLVSLASRKKQRNELVNQLESLTAVSNQVHEQLREGMVSQLEVFESERSLLAAKLAIIENKHQILSDTVNLYKALGGGWKGVN